MNPALKLTEEVAADIRARVKALDFGSIEKANKAKEQNGTFDVIISTEDLDRSGEIVRQNGWEMTNYKNNPIVLWGHDYYSLPIGVCLETYLTEKNGVPALGAKGVFLSADINPLAQQVRKLYEFGLKQGEGVGCTTSVGFIPKEFDESNQRVITRAELLEFSFVPVPANQGVGPARGRSITFDEAKELGLDVVGMRQKGVDFAKTMGFIPEAITELKAPTETAWTNPSLKDFTDKDWKDISDVEKRAIEGHFAYIKSTDAPHQFEDLKLPYRRPSDGAVVLRGLQAAMSALVDEVDVNGDRHEVYDFLAPNYKLFNKEAPAFATLKEAQAGDACTTDDGSPGVLTGDPKDPDGAMVCMPQEQDKSAEGAHASQKALLKAVADEHERHTGEMDKAIDAYEPGDTAEATRENMKDIRSAIADEHTMHRAKSVAAFRGFDPSEDKAFDKNPHLKALRSEHDTYEAKNNKVLDEFEAKCVKTVQGDEGHEDDLTSWITGKMEENQRIHKKAVAKVAKAMCKSAFGEEDQADEKTLEILKEYLAPHIDAQLLPAVAAKIGTKLSAATKAKLGEAHEHLKAAKAVLEGLHPGLADGDGEEKPAEGEGKTEPAPVNNRSKPRTPSHSDEALKAHIQAREIMGGIEAAARDALGKFNAEIRAHSKK